MVFGASERVLSWLLSRIWSGFDIFWLLVFLAGGSLFAAQAGGPKQPVDFNRDIAPIFEKSCAACHNANMAQAKLRLDSEAAILAGGVSGPAIVPGKSGDSLLVKRILGTTDAPRMPMGGAPLSAEQVQLIRRWIDEGKFSAAQSATKPQSADAPTTADGSLVLSVRVRRSDPYWLRAAMSCHGPETQQNGLRLDSLAAVLKGSDSGRIRDSRSQRQEPDHAAFASPGTPAHAVRRTAAERR